VAWVGCAGGVGNAGSYPVFLLQEVHVDKVFCMARQDRRVNDTRRKYKVGRDFLMWKDDS
jgi:hypothetical protein